MNLDELRMEIDKVDDQLIRLFAQRMDIAAQIAEYKKQHNLPVLNAAREREKLSMITDASREDMKDNMRVLYSLIFELTPLKIRQSCFPNGPMWSARASTAPTLPWPARSCLQTPM